MVDLVHLAVLVAHSRRTLAADNLFLRKQLALVRKNNLQTLEPMFAKQFANDFACLVFLRDLIFAEHNGYQIAALVCFVGFADNMLRRIEGQEEAMFLWVSSGRWELIVVSWMLSVLVQLLF